jgi:hypothetical protein
MQQARDTRGCELRNAVHGHPSRRELAARHQHPTEAAGEGRMPMVCCRLVRPFERWPVFTG